jgi:hypothetical protein
LDRRLLARFAHLALMRPNSRLRAYHALSHVRPTRQKENSTMSNLLKSRKFWGAVVGVLIVVLRQFLPQFPVSDEAITNLVYLIVAYIIGTGLEDSSPLRAR